VARYVSGQEAGRHPIRDGEFNQSAGRALIMVVNSRPSPLLYVYDGSDCANLVLARGKLGFEAIDRNEQSLGFVSNTARGGNRDHAGAAMSAAAVSRQKMPGREGPGKFEGSVSAQLRA